MSAQDQLYAELLAQICKPCGRDRHGYLVDILCDARAEGRAEAFREGIALGLTIAEAAYDVDSVRYDDEAALGLGFKVWRSLLAHHDSEHCGDCTSDPQTCLRCYYETRMDEAETIRARAGEAS